MLISVPPGHYYGQCHFFFTICVTSLTALESVNVSDVFALIRFVLDLAKREGRF